MKKQVYCPACGRYVFTYDGRATMELPCRCKHCDQLVVYNPINGRTTNKEKPQRGSSSGMRIW